MHTNFAINIFKKTNSNVTHTTDINLLTNKEKIKHILED